jgi:exonuclease III
MGRGPDIEVADTYKIETLNVSGMSAMTRMRMLADFLRKQEIDIILLQEVTHNDFDLIRGYNAYTNVGVNKSGTAILTREAIQLTNITRLPSGRGMSAFYRGVWIIQ